MNTSDGLKLKNENEKLKLENEKLKLENRDLEFENEELSLDNRELKIESNDLNEMIRLYRTKLNNLRRNFENVCDVCLLREYSIMDYNKKYCEYCYNNELSFR